MMLRFLVALTLVLAFSSAVRSADKDGDSIEGTWRPATAEIGGKVFLEEARKAMKLMVKDDQYTVTIGMKVDKGTVKVNGAGKPKQIDITGTDGPNKGKTFLAIFERDGDTLRICYDLSGKARPTEFKSTEGSQLFLVTYKREKP